MSNVQFSCIRLRRVLKRPRCCGFLVIGWILSFVIFCILTYNTPAMDRRVHLKITEGNGSGNYVRWHGEYRSHGDNHGSRRAALIIHKYTKSATPKMVSYITRYLESFRIHYVISRTDDRSLIDLKYEMTKDASKAKYSLIIFYEFQTFLSLSRLVRDVINSYCAKFKAGQIFFAGNNYGRISEFNLEIKRLGKDKSHSLRVNPDSKILWITKPGVETAKPSRTRRTYIRVFSFDDRYEAVAYLVPTGSTAETGSNVRGEDKKIAMLLDKGEKAGIKRIFTTLNSAFFLHGLLFLDALKHLSVLPSKYTLQRYIQVDIDDIFIGKTGLRLKKADVKELLLTQKFLQRKIPGFQFQIGFSGKGYGRGNEDEDEGDNELIAHASSFSWFCHMWDHEQAHKFDNLTILTNLMEKNKRFAKKHNIAIDSGYAVSSHHSGVYPVQESLYQAWRNVYGNSVTSTEEYPNLKPAWRRKGFQYMGIKVLPRQTCNIYTSTNYFREIEGGKQALDQSAEGGEIFETILRNPVSIFMSHMTNYANDRVAPHLFKKLVKFLQRWTNLKLMSAPPKQLAEIYFNNFPDEATPVWQNPCDYNRHLAIWPIDKSCSRLPSLLVMGPPHGGHELLAKFLQVHPRMKGAEQDSNGYVETHFFSSDNYIKGLDWYMNFFPKQTELYEKIFEVSSTYFESTVASYRANALLKIAKIIIVLPDPIQRAYMHYMYLKNNRISSVAQKYSFDDFIMKKTGSSEAKTLRNQLLITGHYANHLTRWMSYYSPQQVMIISDDDLMNRTRTVLDNIQDFVNIEKPVNYNQLLRYDTRVHMYCPLNTNTVQDCYGYKNTHCNEMSKSARDYLQTYYEKHNKNLLRLNQKVQFSVPKWLKVYG